MDMTFSNKTANVALSSFALQLNKNSFGLVPSEALRCSPLAPGQSFETSLRFAVIEIVPTGTNGCASQILFPDTNGAIHLVWSQWDSQLGTISQFGSWDWDTLYQSSKSGGTPPLPPAEFHVKFDDGEDMLLGRGGI